MDRYSRRIVGWELQDHMQESLVIGCLRNAIGERQPMSGLIHHTDRGGQYAGGRYRQLLTRARMRQSMSRADDCYDNAFMESCFGTLKTELDMKPYQNACIARKEIPEYVRYYNTRRRHSAIGYLSPEAFELQQPPRTSTRKTAATQNSPRDRSTGASFSCSIEREEITYAGRRLQRAPRRDRDGTSAEPTWLRTHEPVWQPASRTVSGPWIDIQYQPDIFS